MKYLIISLILLIVVSNSAADVQLYEVDTYFELPKIKSQITQNDKEMIQNGLKGAAQFMKFLVEKNFFKMLTTISKVAGPIFQVASILLDIVFLFIDIESPEMALMKKEFENLNNRIDSWTYEFNEIKRKIDWSAVQINFGEIENSIITMNNMVKQIPKLTKEVREEEARRFINSYITNYKSSGLTLYLALINIDAVYSENLIRASQKYYQYNRKLVQTFMMSNVVLLTQAMQIEATYVKLKYQSQKNVDFVQSLWSKRLAVLKEKMEKIDLETKDAYITQYPKDLDELLATRYSLSNQDFTSVAMQYFNTKYDWRQWFIVTYAPMWGFKDHTVSTCRGTIRFRSHGRNIIVSSLDESELNSVSQHISKNRNLIGSYNNWYSDREFSRGWVNYMRSRLPTCNDVDTVVSIKWGGNVWFSQSSSLIYQKNCVYGSGTCYNTFLFG